MNSGSFYTTLGQKLRARRRAKHLTLNDLAEKLNKSTATISKYEKGEIFISIDTLVDICRILNIEISSLLPDTCVTEDSNDLTRYQKYFSEQLYLYWFNGEKNKLQKAVLINQKMSFKSTMYYDVADTANYYDANYVYDGRVSYTDSCIDFILSCTEPPFDTLTLRVSSLNRHTSYKIGLLTTISYFYQNIAMKVIVSETPLPEDEALISSLRLTPEELKNIKRTNFFYAQ
ncbi:helix-turn-helix transcriptional regulator [Faecalicatena fissicatena]|uniref:Helix-turn-helix transcriptional regulator n=1 Tax=Faecalicatena fissicatena TaxID=290055 RepID=A0ABS2E6L8_9FIRM|nr:helix-turn-helix transcriptional regulator [Faecalicatena fissicatena]